MNTTKDDTGSQFPKFERSTTFRRASIVPYYISENCMNESKLKTLKPAFFQEMNVSKNNLTKPLAKENYVQILNTSSEFIARLYKDIRKMEGIEKIKKIINQ